MREQQATFATAMQEVILAEFERAAGFQRLVLLAVATESSHVHVLLSWQDERSWRGLRLKVKESLSGALNASLGKRQWFSRNASRKRVRDLRHLRHLAFKYLPDHSGAFYRNWHFREL